jgi:hypothetical protein
MENTYTFGEYKVSGNLTTDIKLSVGTFGQMFSGDSSFYCNSLTAPKYFLTRGSAGTATANGTTPVFVNTDVYAFDGNTIFVFTNRSQTLVATPPFKLPRISFIEGGANFAFVADAGDTQTYNWIAIN